MLAFGSKSDPITPFQLVDLQDRLQQLGLLQNSENYAVMPLPGSSHAFQYWDSGMDDCGDTPAVMAQVAMFLQMHTLTSSRPTPVFSAN